MRKRLNIADMNCDLCKALGIDPRGITELLLKLSKDAPPRIEVTYSARYVSVLDLDTEVIPQTYSYELRLLDDPEYPGLQNATIEEVVEGADPRPEHPLVQNVTGVGEMFDRYYPVKGGRVPEGEPPPPPRTKDVPPDPSDLYGRDAPFSWLGWMRRFVNRDG